MFENFFVVGAARDTLVAVGPDYTYSYPLVLLSGLLAILASTTAFYLTARISAANNMIARLGWLTTGALSMGGGIWAMHFVGMLALSMPNPVSYDVVLTGLSIMFSIAASGTAFFLVNRGVRTAARLVIGGVVLGGGIGAMHYTCMAAMRMNAVIRYDPYLFGFSVVVAVSLSTLALHLLFRCAEPGKRMAHRREISSGCVMGLSITAMHYTGMAATHFIPASSRMTGGLQLDGQLMAAAIAVGAVLVAGLALAASVVDLRLELHGRKTRQSRDFLAAIINNTADGIIAIDQRGLVRVYNPAAERMFGYERSEIVGKNVSMLLSGEERAAHDDYIRNARVYEPKILGSQRVLYGQRKDGSSVPLEISVSSMENEDGRMFIGVCHDISARKEAEETIRDARYQAEIANNAKSEFLANMSHELRTPLNAILGFSEIMMKEAFGPIGGDRYRNYAGDIHGSGQHLLELINDILDLSKIEAGNEELHEENIEIPELLHSVMTLVKGQAKKNDVSLKLEFPDTLPALRADGRKIKQMLVNVLSNAVKFTQAGGGVTLEIECPPEAGCVVRISDTGIGMAQDDIPRALMPFSRIDNLISRGVEGTGLGLPLARRLAELHGGSLDVQSTLGVGTTVTIELPAERTVAAVATPRARLG